MKWEDYKSWMCAQLLCLALQVSVDDMKHPCLLFGIHGAVAGLWTLAYVGLKRGW